MVNGSPFVYSGSSRLQLYGWMSEGLVFLIILMSFMGLHHDVWNAESWYCAELSVRAALNIGLWSGSFELVNILRLHRPNCILLKMSAASALLCSLYIGICFTICFPLLHSSPSVAFLLSPSPTIEMCDIVEVSLDKILADYAPTLWLLFFSCSLSEAFCAIHA